MPLPAAHLRQREQPGAEGGGDEPSINHFHATEQGCSSAQPALCHCQAPATVGKGTGNSVKAACSEQPIHHQDCIFISLCRQGEGQEDTLSYGPLSSLPMQTPLASSSLQGSQSQPGSKGVTVPGYSFHTRAPLICRVHFPEAKAFSSSSAVEPLIMDCEFLKGQGTRHDGMVSVSSATWYFTRETHKADCLLQKAYIG